MKDTPPAADPATIAIELGDCTDKNAVLQRFARALHFPPWFGNNWDALADALDDLCWLDPPPARIVVHGLPAFATQDAESALILGDILAGLAEQRSAQGPALELAQDASQPAVADDAAAQSDGGHTPLPRTTR